MIPFASHHRKEKTSCTISFYKAVMYENMNTNSRTDRPADGSLSAGHKSHHSVPHKKLSMLCCPESGFMRQLSENVRGTRE